ncbi:SRPBCC family protein [Mycolicibacterium sp. Dal123E01]|uniref:SRPBCC family protein n=1 Tax=Mycolicibacterium sp. Dal123E01 TaxID=3457578 RepID=UPI00403E6FEF
MAEIHRTQTVAADPQAIWAVLADFGAISAWAANVDHSCLLSPAEQTIGVGTTRRVQVGRNTLLERITEIASPTSLAYDVEGFPRRLTVNNRWTLTPVNNATAVTLISTVTFTGPLRRVVEGVVTRVSANQVDTMLAGIAKRVESQHV